METIGILMKLIVLLFFVAVGIGFMLFPILFDADVKNKIGKGFLNRWMTGIEFICIIGCFDPSSDGFYGNVGFLILSVAAASLIAWKKAKKLHLDSKTAIGGVVAQVFSPVSLLLIVIMLGRLAGKLKKTKK